MNDICKKTGLKFMALARITPFIDFNKKELLVNAFFKPQLQYYNLIWM